MHDNLIGGRCENVTLPKAASCSCLLVCTVTPSAAVHNRLTALLCHSKYTSENLLFIQGYSKLTPMHCSTVQGKMQALATSAAVQNRLTALLCHTPVKICWS